MFYTPGEIIQRRTSFLTLCVRHRRSSPFVISTLVCSPSSFAAPSSRSRPLSHRLGASGHRRSSRQSAGTADRVDTADPVDRGTCLTTPVSTPTGGYDFDWRIRLRLVAGAQVREPARRAGSAGKRRAYDFDFDFTLTLTGGGFIGHCDRGGSRMPATYTLL